MITASALPRLRRCRAVVSLPQYPTDSEWARRGTAIHRYLATGELHPDYEEECKAIDLDGLPKGRNEVAFAWSSVDGKCRELGSSLDRNYDLQPGEIAGTVDLVGLEGDNFVLDYKTGWLRQDPVAENWQLLFAALCLSRVRGLSEVVVQVNYLKEDGGWFVDCAYVDTFTLAAFEADLREALKGGPPAPGDHCRNCPSFTACPAKIGLIRELATSLPNSYLRITPENAADAYERLGKVKEACGAVEAALKAYAAEATIPLGDGRYYGVVETIKEDILAPEAGEILGMRPGVFKFTTSKTAIIKAYGKEAMDRLRAAGAVTTRTLRTVREFKK